MDILQQKPFVVIVDFAHTSNSTLNALRSAKKLVKDNGRLIHVFGCAGQRDPGKRYEMGKTSNEYADITILTAEDPRFESLKILMMRLREGGEMVVTKKLRYLDLMMILLMLRLGGMQYGKLLI